MADPKPWEVDYEEPKPWDVKYQAPESQGNAFDEFLKAQGGPQTMTQFMPGYMKERAAIGSGPSIAAGLGTGLSAEGKALVAGAGDVGSVVFRPVTEQLYPEQAEAGPMPAENIRALLETRGQGPLPAEDLRVLPKPAQITGRAAQGLIETVPKLAGVAAAEGVGIPAPIAAGAIFGLTPDGFDPKQAAIAAVLPFVGKYSGAMVEALAGKLGVTKDAALNIFNKLGGATGAAGYLKAIDESEISKLPPEQRDQARIDSWANVASQAALGMMGEREPKQPKETDARTDTQAEEVHGNVLREPGTVEQKMPTPKSSEGVRTETEGGIPKEAITDRGLLHDQQVAADAAAKPDADGITRLRSVPSTPESKAHAIELSKTLEDGDIIDTADGQRLIVSKIKGKKSGRTSITLNTESGAPLDGRASEDVGNDGKVIPGTWTVDNNYRSIIELGKITRKRGASKEEAGPHPTADQLISMTPDELVAWKSKHKYGMNFEPTAGTTSVEIAEKLKPEDIPKLEAERDKLRADFRKEYQEALKSKDPDRLGKTLPTQLKSQTLDEIIADYHEGAANTDYVQYQRLVRELKRAPLEDRFKMSQDIETIKNKYGGKPPPRDLPKAEVPEPTETVLASQAESPLQEAINKYEDTGDIETVRDLADHVEGLIDEGKAPESLRNALDDYRAALKEDFEQYAGRGDMEEAEQNFIDALRQHSETPLESRATPTPTHGLPASVPDRGPTFASELLEASRQLGALVRSRATLRPGVLGQFVRSKLGNIQQADRIEVGDIRNQKTVAHEIGHSLDGILWPKVNFGDSQASLAARVGTGTGKELNAELTKVSELMRGPMTGSKGHIAYRKRATELIADFVSLYAHDPDRARAMAPKFAKGFEDALARDKNTGDVVQGIVSGNVIPKPPDPTLKKQLAGITGTPPQPGTTMPGKVPARVNVPIAREYEVQHAAQELVKGEERMFRSKVEASRIFGDKERKLVPDESDRNDAGAFMEGIGNQNLPGDTIDRVRTRMTPTKEQFVKDFRFRIELSRQELNKYLKGLTDGEYIKFLEDYLPHIYVQTGAKLQGALRAWKNSPHAKQRILPTVKEAVDLGLTPITQDPSVLHEVTEKMNWRVATNKKFLDGIRNDVKTASGNPVVVPHGQGEEGWIHTEHPLLKRIYARGTPSGLMLWEKGADVHPDVWPALRQILEPAPSWTISKAYDQINAFARATRFLGSLMHDFSLYKAAIGSMATAKNPLRGLVRLFETNPVTGERESFRTTRSLGKQMRQNEEIMTQAALDGLQFSDRPSQAFEESAHSALEDLAKKTSSVPILGKTTKALSTLQEWRRKNLWENTHDALKIVAHNDITNRLLEKAPPGTDVKAVRDKIASALNDSFGGQEWQTHFWSSPTVRKYMSRFMLAPDWTISVLRSVPFVSDAATLLRSKVLERLSGRGPAPAELEGSLGNKLRARILGVELGVLAISAASIQYAIYKAFGDDKKGDKPFMWDNELDQKGRIDVTPLMRRMPWHDPKDPTRQYVNLGKREGEIVRWFTRPDQEIIGKLSTPAAIVYEQISGQEGDFKATWKQDHESFIESLPQRTVALGKQALPFTFQGNQFALSVPMQKGMTKYKAQQAYESVFELAAQPNKLRSLLRGQKSSEGTLSEMASQITDAAKRNGVPAEEVLKRSLSIVRGHHYNEFFKAFNKGDSKKMDEEARAIIILGGTTKTLEESVKRRIAVEPIPVGE